MVGPPFIDRNFTPWAVFFQGNLLIAALLPSQGPGPAEAPGRLLDSPLAFSTDYGYTCDL
jgi:hypothetical protein